MPAAPAPETLGEGAVSTADDAGQASADPAPFGDTIPAMTGASEASADDPRAVAEAISRAADGEVIHLVRDGRPVADVVPAVSSTDPGSDRDWIAARQTSQRMADRFGAPTLEHYRRVYQSLQVPWPGDAEIRRRYPVAITR